MEALVRLLGCCRRHPATLAWPAAGALLALAGREESTVVRLLVGIGVSLPGLLWLAYRLGGEAPPPAAPSIPPERTPLGARLRAWARRHAPRDGVPHVDPLRSPIAAVAVTLLVIATATLALVLSIAGHTPAKLPAVALSSPAIFHLQRMLVPTFAVALLSVFLTRAAFGYFPQKVSTTSAEWPGIAAAAQDIKTTAASRQLADVVSDLADEQEQLSDGQEQLFDRTAVLEDDTAVQAEDIARLGDAAAGQSQTIVVLRRAFIAAVPNGEAVFQREWEKLERELSES